MQRLSLSFLLGFIFLSVFFTCFSSSAQNFAIPAKYNIGKPEDYHKYDSLALKCAHWLSTVAPGTENKKAEEARRFLEYWVSGNDYINYVLLPRVEAIFADNSEYRGYYIAGWVIYSFSYPGQKKPMLGAYAGMKSVIHAYEIRNKEKRHHDIEELCQANASGQLKNWIQERLN
jgi:hypothetical protein